MHEHDAGYDLVIVGCGMAGLAAAVRAGELGLSTAVLEKTSREKRGGQTRYVQSFRVPSADCDLSPWGLEFDVPDYTVEEFHDDVMKQTNGRADPELARTLVEEAGPTVEWLAENGVEWSTEPLHVGYTVGRTFCEGEELVASLVERAEELGAEVYYDTAARAVHETNDRRIAGVETVRGDDRTVFTADAVLIAGGAYESDPRKRTVYYGDGYDAMKVRGSPYNTGEAIDMALDVGARAVGQWSGAHMALIDANSPDAEGGANRIDGYQYCVLINHEGERFVDEGQDARAHTYAKFGRLIFEEPGHEAFIVADAAMEDQLWPDGPSDPTYGETVVEVLEKLGCEDPEQGAETVEAYNAACDPPNPFDPDVLDGNAAEGIDPPKSNWAIPLDEPPYVGYPVTGGITFSFGGVEADTDGRVIDTRGREIAGLYAAGNSTGGLFFDNYPGGTGLTNAAVFGKRAAEAVAADGERGRSPHEER